MNDKSVSPEESMEKMKENFDFIKFIENGIETGNPEIINNIPISALKCACNNSQPSNQENEMNPESLIEFHESDLNTNISNDQRILNNIQSHTSHECETGKEGQFTFNDKEVSNIRDNISRGIIEPKIYQTMNSSQVYGINYGNMQTRQDLTQNSESGNKTPCIDDFSWKESATNQMAFERNCLTGIVNEFQTTKESPSLNQGMQVFNNVGKNPLFTFGQKIASNTSISEIVQNVHEPITISDSMTSNCSRENMLTVPGQYSYLRNMNNPNLCTDKAFQTIKESPSLNQKLQVLGDVGQNAIFTVEDIIASNTSISEIARNDHEPSEISDSMASNFPRENVFTDPGQYIYLGNVNNPNLCTDNTFQTIKESPSLNQGMEVFGDVSKNVLLTVGETIASNTSISEIAQNDREPSDISDSMASNCSRENMLSVTDSTGYHWNENNPNLLGDTLQSLHQSEKGKVLTCNVCKAKIANHKHTYVANILYECCICDYNDNEPYKLHLHSCTHLPYKFCNICLKEHTEGDSHDGGKTCTVPLCNKTFHCRTQLKEHLLDHEGFFQRHCWNCCRSSAAHSTRIEGKLFYVCCLCKFKTRNVSNWKVHKNTHSPKFFCRICREEYPAEEKSSHQSEYTCKIKQCKIKFKCKGLSEQHSIDHEGYFYSQCRVCDEKISDHKISDQSYNYKCCICPQSVIQKSELISHLYKHFDLKVYKCDTCGGRFKLRSGLDKHSESCPAVPYICESCPARFPYRDFLDLHCSVKHKKV